MEYRKFNENKYVVRIDKDEEVLEKLKELCIKEKIELGYVVGIGASKKVTIGLYDVLEKKYHKKTIEEPLEITSLVGNISTKDNENYLHLHINVCNKEMSCYGGHLNECIIGATCELNIVKLNGKVERSLDDITGLNLYKFL